MEDAVDAILSKYSFQGFDHSLEANPTFTRFDGLDPVSGPSLSAPPSEPHLTTLAPLQRASASSSSHFAALKMDSEVEQTKASAIPANTKKNTGWAVNI